MQETRPLGRTKPRLLRLTRIYQGYGVVRDGIHCLWLVQSVNEYWQDQKRVSGYTTIGLLK